jgi:hypothetical protein
MTLDGTAGSIAEDSHDGLDESAEISYGDSFEADASLLRSTDVNGSAMDMSSDDAGFYDNEAGTGGGAEVMTFSQDNISDNIILEDDSIGDSISIDMSSTPASPLHSPAARPKSAPRHDVDFSMSVGDDTLGDASISMDAEEFNTAVQTRPETAQMRPAATRPISAKGRPRGSPPPPPPPPEQPAAAAPWAGALSDGDDDDDDVEIVDERGFSFPPSPRSPAAVEAEGATEALHRQLSGNDPMEQLRAFERDEGLSPDTHVMSPKSPAAVEAEDETDALHRMLAGNDPSSLRAQFSPPEENKNENEITRRDSNTNTSRMSLDESVAEEVADESAAALEVLDESAEEIATEPRTSRRFHADYTETFESMDGSKLLAEEHEEAPEDVPRDANGSKEQVSDVSMRSSSNDGSGDLGSVGAKAKALLHDLRAIRRGGKPSGKDVVALTKLLRELQTATHRRRIGLARRAGAVVASWRPGKEDFTSAFANPGGKRIQTQKPIPSEPEPPLESYETTREEWSAYLVGEGRYPAGAPHPLGLDHDTKSYREIWNAQQLHEKLRDACENLRDATERPADTSTYRAVAAALQAHSVNGILRAKVAAIQMRLRSAAQKRELQRARATARA